MNEPARTWEAVELDARPGLRDSVERSAEFQRWRAELGTVVIDGETFYLPWGDVPMDSDQIIYQWARTHGLLGD